jgi:hypothetical protein
LRVGRPKKLARKTRAAEVDDLAAETAEGAQADVGTAAVAEAMTGEAGAGVTEIAAKTEGKLDCKNGPLGPFLVNH